MILYFTQEVLMSAIKLIAIDLDDTLLHDDISVSDYTKKVLKSAMDKGVKIVIATGRMFQAARPWGQAIGLGDVPMICYTGSMTGLCERGKVLRDVRIDYDLALVRTGDVVCLGRWSRVSWRRRGSLSSQWFQEDGGASCNRYLAGTAVG